MSMTYDELKQQYTALKKTFDYMMSRKQDIIDFYRSKAPESITFIGCGSGYCLCQSGEISTKVRLGVKAATLAAGDLMLNYEKYSKILKGTLLFAPSRSGSTSEVIKAVENAKTLMDLPVLAITCVEGDRKSVV